MDKTIWFMVCSLIFLFDLLSLHSSIKGYRFIIICYTPFNKKKFFFTSTDTTIKLKMSYFESLKTLSPDRKDFVLKIYNEIDNNATINVSNREEQKTKFLQL